MSAKSSFSTLRYVHVALHVVLKKYKTPLKSLSQKESHWFVLSSYLNRRRSLLFVPKRFFKRFLSKSDIFSNPIDIVIRSKIVSFCLVRFYFASSSCAIYLSFIIWKILNKNKTIFKFN